MSTGLIIAIAIPVLVILAGAVALTSARRRDAEGLGHLSRETKQRDKEATASLGDTPPAPTGREVERAAAVAQAGGTLVEVRSPGPVEPWSPPDPEAVGVTRRQFLNRSMVLLTTLGTVAFGATVLAFLWPAPKGGFGARISVGSIAAVNTAIDVGTGSGVTNFAYYPVAKSYITRFPPDALEAASAVYAPPILSGMEEGYTALFQKCPHLGCKVPACETSQWFECPCHGSKYTRVGEKKAGPAPRGLDRFPIAFDNDEVFIETGALALGPPIGTDTTAQGAEGPPCTDGGGHG
jgi:cytochrome b6-f complex iron-sulfur subunit